MPDYRNRVVAYIHHVANTSPEIQEFERSSYKSVINHPENGCMLNKKESAKFLGVSRKKFMQIAPGPDYFFKGIWPFWSKRVLEVIPTCDFCAHEEQRRQGLACGSRLKSGLTPKQRQELFSHIDAAQYPEDQVPKKMSSLLAEYGVSVEFDSPKEARVFGNGVKTAMRS